MFLLVPAHLGSTRQRAIKQLCVCVSDNKMMCTPDDNAMTKLYLYSFQFSSSYDKLSKHENSSTLQINLVRTTSGQPVIVEKYTFTIHQRKMHGSISDVTI